MGSGSYDAHHFTLMTEERSNLIARSRQSGGTLAPFSYPVFRAIWIAMMFSSFGSLIQQVGAAWLMVTLTSSHVMVALVAASNTIPIMLMALFAGAIADSYDRRRVMIFAQALMLLASVALMLLTRFGHITPVPLLMLTLIVGVGTTLNGPAWQASIRTQVDPVDVPAAISLNSISFNMARSVGPALGGLLISLAGPALNFAVNAASYLGILFVLARWKPSETKLRQEPLIPAIRRGLDFCFGTREIRHTLVRVAAFGFSCSGLSSLTPLIARDLLGGNQFTFGLLLGAFGAGSIIGALAVGRLRARFGAEGTLSLASCAFGLGCLGITWVNSSPIAMVMMLMAGWGWVSTLTTINVIIQTRAPDDITGRCVSIYHMSAFGAAAIGAACWGALADATDLRTSLSVSGLTLLATLLLRFVAPLPVLRDGAS